MAGAVGWGFSTYVLFWVGWSVGPATATFPLLLLGLRRLARAPGRAAIGLTAAALWLAFCAGHPESFFHGVAAGGVYFLWELSAASGRGRAIAGALGAGGLALLLSGPQLFPLLEAIPRSAEYRARRQSLASGSARQSVALAEAARRLLPDVLPFAHGIYGRSPVQTPRNDGSGMPLGYAGAVLFPLALAGLGRRRPVERGRSIFLVFALAGLAYGASLPGLHDLTSRLPGFALALNYRLVFLAGLGLSGLAAFGARRVETESAGPRLAAACAVVVAVLLAAFLLSGPVFADRALPAAFVTAQFLQELVPVVLLGALAAAWRRGRPIASAAIVLLAAQRFLEMRGVYPTLPASTLAPPLPGLASMSSDAGSRDAGPSRVVAAGTNFRPNGATLYGLEDVRGYESLVLDRFADTYVLWCRAQPASFNLVTDLGAPFLGFLNARYAIGGPRDPAPAGWRERARTAELAVFENPLALPRAFVPRTLRREPDAGRRLEALRRETDFARTAWLSAPGAGRAEEPGGEAALRLREIGPDLAIEAEVATPRVRRDLAAGLAGVEGDRERNRHSARDGQPRVRRLLAAARVPRGPSEILPAFVAARSHRGGGRPSRRHPDGNDGAPGFVDHADGAFRRALPRGLRGNRGDSALARAPLRSPAASADGLAARGGAPPLHGKGDLHGCRLRADRHPVQRLSLRLASPGAARRRRPDAASRRHRLSADPVARRRARGARGRPAAALEPARSCGGAAARGRAIRRAAPGHPRGHAAASAAGLDVRRDPAALPRAAGGVPLPAGPRLRHARVAPGRIGLGASRTG